MSSDAKKFRSSVRVAKIRMWMAARASRGRKGWLDRMITNFINRALAVDPERDFMRDELVESEPGFDAEELARYERGEG